MAHRTRKRLSKTELKKDPVNEALLKGMGYLQRNLKQFIIGGIAILVVILVIQSLSSSASQQASESRARYFLAGQLYSMGMDNLQYGNMDEAVSQLQSAQQLARNNNNNYPGRLPGKRSLILASKVGIMFGMNSEVVSQLQDFLAADPGGDLELSAQLHLAVCLENRGGASDLAESVELYGNILERSPENSQLSWEAHSGLSRIEYRMENYQEALDHLHSALEISPDTTDFMEYQLARLEVAMR